MKFYSILFFLILLWNFVHSMKKLHRLTRREILMMDKNKESLFLAYINPKNISHIFFIDELSKFLDLNPLDNFNFGFLEIEKDSKMLEFFKIKNIRDSGVILYKFDNKNYYIEEGINHLSEVRQIFEKINDNKLNWSTNSIIENIFYYITGKRYGKEAHSLFSFGICLISLLIYIYINIKVRRAEREMIEKKRKTK